MIAQGGKQLDPGRKSLESQGFEAGLRRNIVGQDEAGKTRVVEATAEVLFGDPRAVIKVDCAEFQHSPKDCEINWLASGLSAGRPLIFLLGPPTRTCHPE